MSTDLVQHTAPRALAIKEWDRQYADLVKRTVLCPDKRTATDVEVALFAEQVQRTRLDPFRNQIYGIFRWDKRAGGEVMQVQVGIDGLRLLAERTGKYLGQTPEEWCGPDGKWTQVWLSDKPPAAARVGVLKAGASAPTFAVALYREYVQTGKNGQPIGQWPRMPANQLIKCAEAKALRKAFPAETSGLTVPEEMGAIEHMPATEAQVAAAEITDAEPVDAEPVTDAVPEDDRSDLVERARMLIEAGVVKSGALVNQLVANGSTSGETVSAAILTNPDRDAVEHLLADFEQAAEGASA